MVEHGFYILKVAVSVPVIPVVKCSSKYWEILLFAWESEEWLPVRVGNR